jgi:two-component system chemotaxis response regulator CheB
MTQPPAHAVGIGASAGGVEALSRLVETLPEQLDAAVLVVLHIPASSRSLLAQILERKTALPVITAEDGAALVPGTIFVAPADRHLVVSDGRVVLERGPKENGARPAVDPMLRSIAQAYGPRAIAVVLSGALGDGSAGARAIAAAGGAVLVQDPDEASVPSMPESTLAAVGGRARRLPVTELGAVIAQLVEAAPKEDVMMLDPPTPLEESRKRPHGPPSGLTCPECHGSLWEVDEGARYRCRVGHAYSAEALVAAQGDTVEAALWTALEVLEERAELLRKLANRHGDARPRSRAQMSSAAEDAMRRAELIRHALGAAGAATDAFDVSAEGAAG